MRIFVLLIVLLGFNVLSAQPDWLYIEEDKDDYNGPEWTQKNKLSLDINEAVFVNWNEGGTNSISGLFDAKTMLNYSDNYYVWNNDAHLRYGVNMQEEREARKTDDLFELNSNLGFKPNENSDWFYMARLNFRTQLSNGYNYPNTDNPISKFMAPGYLFFGGGMEYGKNNKNLSLYFSPLTLKATFVFDDALANSGAFGVTPAVYDAQGNVITPGEQIRREVGVLLTNTYIRKLVKNIEVKNQLSLYSDYINNFGNIDIDWRLDFDFKVNSFVRANFGTHLRYDDDIKTVVPSDVEGEFDEAGAKVQWKQFLGVGIAFDF
ncbi:DUF3078 domain-containing protein [Tamlana agarivorans]|uniref:DUF3078 domain-containing protein n=1 Tax=Pseudotamlana agarivorans TaxID=481183 RepID=A0ACC5UB52_9FLAO|nr:DUF3078 domain-containing protein [Tamlana agarivorans]MBU2951562.1 DUF3078 domain-containing protein [Tamlana agarivorans]